MLEAMQHFWLFVLAVINQYVLLAAGCILTVVIGIIERHIVKRQISYKAEVAVLAAFVLIACFRAWDVQFRALKPAPQQPIQVNVPAAQINVPPPQVVVINKEGTGTPLGFMQIVGIFPVQQHNALREGRDLVFNVVFENLGLVPVDDFQNGMTLTIERPGDEPQMKRRFAKYLAMLQRNSGGLRGGETIGIREGGRYNSAQLHNLTREQIAAILNGSERLYLQVWGSWLGEDGHHGQLHYCGWIQNPSENPFVPGGIIFHSCDEPTK